MKIFFAIENSYIIKALWSYENESQKRTKVHALVALKSAIGVLGKLLELKEDGIIDAIFLDTGTYWHNRTGHWDGVDESGKYNTFVQRNGDMIDVIASYDIDFNDPEHYMGCHFRLMSAINDTVGRKVLPVVHDTKRAATEFREYVEDGAQYIAIGSQQSIDDEEWQKINVLRKTHGVKIHLFGNLRSDQLKLRMPDSIDTARYAIDAIYGSFFYWDNTAKEILKLKRLGAGEFTDVHKVFLREVFDFSPVDFLAKPERQWIVNMYAIRRLEEYLTNEWYPNHEFNDEGVVVEK